VLGERGARGIQPGPARIEGAVDVADEQLAHPQRADDLGAGDARRSGADDDYADVLRSLLDDA
jgi:hypothetical protein